MAEGHQLAGPPESSGRRRAPVQTRTFDSLHLEHFPAKWIPRRVAKPEAGANATNMRQNKELEH
jgi:hypothetical protein